MSIGRIVDIEQDDIHLSIKRGFLIIEKEHIEAASIPIDQIDAVIAHAHGLSYTNNVLVKLAEHGAAFVFCGANHSPAGYLITAEGHHKQAARIDAQIRASSRLKGRLWKDIIRAKIVNQGTNLKQLNRPHAEALFAMSQRVKLDDPDNLEAQAARRYWGALFGVDFRRDRGSAGINAMLNYGYAVLRALIVRNIMASGLLPVIGLHHCNQNNPMRLADDLIEPLRPLVDFQVYQLVNQGFDGVTPEVKRILGTIGHIEVTHSKGATALRSGIEYMCLSLVHVFENGKGSLDIPDFAFILTD